MKKNIPSMDSKRIEELDIQVGKWYWHYELDRPVCLVNIEAPIVAVPTVSLAEKGAPYGSGYFFQRKVNWRDLGDIEVAANPLAFACEI